MAWDMPRASAFPRTASHYAFVAQSAIVAGVIAIAAFAPRAGQPAIYLELLPSRHHPALDWALANGAYVIGTGPAGGLVLARTPPDLALRAAREGALAFAVPAFMCIQPESRING